MRHFFLMRISLHIRIFRIYAEVGAYNAGWHNRMANPSLERMRGFVRQVCLTTDIIDKYQVWQVWLEEEEASKAKDVKGRRYATCADTDY